MKSAAVVVAFSDRLDRITYKVQQHLLDLQNIYHDDRSADGQYKDELHIKSIEVRLAQFNGLLDGTVQFALLAIAAIKGHQGTQPSNHQSSTIDLRRCLSRGFLDQRDIRSVRSYRVKRNPHISAGCRKRLIDFMCNRGSKFAGIGKPAEAREQLPVKL